LVRAGASYFPPDFYIAIFGAVCRVVVLALMKDRPGIPHERENIFQGLENLTRDSKAFLIPRAFFSLAYFSFGFLLLRAMLSALPSGMWFCFTRFQSFLRR